MKLKVGIIGAGFIGAAHIEAIQRLGVAEVVAIAGSNQKATELRANELGIPLAYGNYKELLANPDIEVVHNCTPNHMHVEVNEQIIAAGKHVLSEKPLSLTSAESERLVAMAEKAEVVHGVNFVYRQYPIVQQMRAMIKDGNIGDVHLIHGTYLQDWLLYEHDYNWRIDPTLGGPLRAVADIGSHWMDIIEHITGLKIEKVFADLGTVYPIRKKPLGKTATFGASTEIQEYEEIKVANEDYGTILFHLNNGAKGSFVVSQVSAGRKNRLNLEINASEKSLYWDQENAAKLWVGAKGEGNMEIVADPALLNASAQNYIHYPGGHYEGWPDAQKNVMKQFYEHILLGKDRHKQEVSFATFKDGHQSMKLLDAVLASHEQQGWVYVN